MAFFPPTSKITTPRLGNEIDRDERDKNLKYPLVGNFFLFISAFEFFKYCNFGESYRDIKGIFELLWGLWQPLDNTLF